MNNFVFYSNWLLHLGHFWLLLFEEHTSHKAICPQLLEYTLGGQSSQIPQRGLFIVNLQLIFLSIFHNYLFLIK